MLKLLEDLLDTEECDSNFKTILDRQSNTHHITGQGRLEGESLRWSYCYFLLTLSHEVQIHREMHKHTFLCAHAHGGLLYIDLSGLHDLPAHNMQKLPEDLLSTDEFDWDLKAILYFRSHTNNVPEPLIYLRRDTGGSDRLYDALKVCVHGKDEGAYAVLHHACSHDLGKKIGGRV